MHSVNRGCFFMKKVYLKPEMVVVELGTVNMLAASAPRWENRNLSGNTSESSNERTGWGSLWDK